MNLVKVSAVILGTFLPEDFLTLENGKMVG